MTLLDQILEALKNPSADHMQIYAGLAIIVAVVASIAFSVLKPKEKPQLMMTMEDDFKAQADP